MPRDMTPRMPFGPHRGVALDRVPLDHLAELMAEPDVEPIPGDDYGRYHEDDLSPFGGAKGKIRRCKVAPLVRERLAGKAPKRKRADKMSIED